jgi:hypothetical protein
VGHAMHQQGPIKPHIYTSHLLVHLWLVVPSEEVHKSHIGVTCSLSNEVEVLLN